MPELPDVASYVDGLRARVVGARLQHVHVRGPALLRTFDPPLDSTEGRLVLGVERLGKRIVFALEHDLFLVLHLMIAGRLRWEDAAPEPGPRADRATRRDRPTASRIEQARLDFGSGTLIITEAGTKKRATLHTVRTRASLRQFDRGGLDVLASDDAAFATRLRAENRTLKRALADPRLFDGIGNAYSDEILHAARLSPVQLTRRLDDADVSRLFEAARGTLRHWIDRLRAQFAGRFPRPGEITAFRPDFAVHGRFGMPCPACGTAVQRIVYAENECNYCPRCQTEGRVLADRSLSRLLKDDWPRTVEELEEP